MPNPRLRLRDGQEEMIMRYTAFLKNRELADRLDFILMDYARIREAENPRKERLPDNI